MQHRKTFGNEDTFQGQQSIIKVEIQERFIFYKAGKTLHVHKMVRRLLQHILIIGISVSEYYDRDVPKIRYACSHICYDCKCMCE